MKKLIIIICAFLIFGCGKAKQIPSTKVGDCCSTEYEILRIKDGCQYIHFFNATNVQAGWGGHYGLCDNPIHTLQ